VPDEPLSVQGQFEIQIDDTAFPVAGPVRVANITVTPNPVVFGDTGRAGESQVMSQFIQSSAAGGSGIYKGNPRTHTDKVWTSRADTRYKDILALPPLSVNMGKPAGSELLPAMLTWEFNNEQYVSFGRFVSRWDDSTLAWVAEQDLGLNNVGVSAAVFLGNLYLASAGFLWKRTPAGVWTSTVHPSYFLAVWDTKLWRLDVITGGYELFASIDGAAWVSRATLPTDITAHQLLVYRDVAGLSSLYLVSDTGLWSFDAVNNRFLQTEVQFPRIMTGTRASATSFRDGKVYLHIGRTGMVSLQAGNPFIVSPMGLDMDDGLPPEEIGDILAVTSDFNWVLALLQADRVGGSHESFNSGLGAVTGNLFPEGAGLLTLRAWNNGWHTIAEHAVTSGAAWALGVSGAYSKRRVYYGAGLDFYYQELTPGLHNPRNLTTRSFSTGPKTHITPWWDWSAAAQLKVQGHLALFSKQCTADEKIEVYYGLDLDDSSWIHMATITSNGFQELKPGGGAGVQMRFIRYRFDLYRGSDASKTPLIEYWATDFMRVLPPTFGYAVELDLTESYKGRTPKEMIDRLKALVDADVSPGFYRFAYQDAFDDEPQTHYGRITRLTGEEEEGQAQRPRGWYTVSFMVPYREDSI
jgi:hypothetical protein